MIVRRWWWIFYCVLVGPLVGGRTVDEIRHLGWEVGDAWKWRIRLLALEEE